MHYKYFLYKEHGILEAAIKIYDAMLATDSAEKIYRDCTDIIAVVHYVINNH